MKDNCYNNKIWQIFKK